MTTPSAVYGFSFNGWLFGGAGQGVQVLSIDGLEDIPSLRTQDEGRGYSDGMWTGSDALNNRAITMTLQIMSDANAPMSTYLAQLKQYLISQTTGTGVLQMFLPNRGVQRVNARVRRRSIRIDPEYTYGRATAVVEFFCPDPRIYNDTQTTGTMLASSGGSRTYPRTYNLAYSGGAIGQTVTLTNAGNYESWPLFTLTGACTAPQILNITTGQVLTFPAVTMAAADVMVVNSDLRAVLMNGAAARNLLGNTSQWFSLPAGVPTTLTLSVGGGNPTCVVSYRDAYI